MTAAVNYPVCFVLDQNFVLPASTAIYSLLRNKDNAINYRIYVCCNDISDQSKKYLETIVKKFEQCQINFIDLNLEKYNSLFEHYDGTTGANSITAFAKFELPYLLENENFVLYLDCDTLILKDISEIFSYTLDELYAAVIKDSGRIYNYEGLRADIDDYFNSGVMLLNLSKMRNDNATDKLIKAKIELNNHKLVDQDAFNIVFQNAKLLLPVKFNALMINLYNSCKKFNIHKFNAFFNTSYSCIYDLEDDVHILHFASKEKPWIYNDVKYSKKWLECYSEIENPIFTEIQKLNFHNNNNVSSSPIVPIMLATDNNYLFQTAVTIVSVLENLSKKVKVDLFILIPSPIDKTEFNEITEKYGDSIVSIHYVIVDNEKYFKEVKIKIKHITKPTFYRLIAPSMIKEYDKIIYIDSDVIVESDISEYYSTDLGQNYLAGVLATSYVTARNGNEKYCKDNDIPKIDQYINAGVIIMNLGQIRADLLESEFLSRVPKGYRSQDQDILNGVCYGKILHLPYKYNCQISKYECDYDNLLKVFSLAEINEAHNCPAIIHYASNIKPWNSFGCVLADRWYKYSKKLSNFNKFLSKSLNLFIEEGMRYRVENYKQYFDPTLIIKQNDYKDHLKNSSTLRLEIRPELKSAEQVFSDVIKILDTDDINSVVSSYPNNKVSYIESSHGFNTVHFKSLSDLKITLRLTTRNINENYRDSYGFIVKRIIINKQDVQKEDILVSYKRPRSITINVKKGEVNYIQYYWSIDKSKKSTKITTTSTTQDLSTLINRFNECFDKLSQLPIVANVLRMDIKNVGKDTNISISKLTDPSAKIYLQSWDKEKNAYVVESAKKNIRFMVKCKNKGILQIKVRGKDVKNIYGTRPPLYVKVSSFMINHKEYITDNHSYVTHDDFIKVEESVEDGSELLISAHWGGGL